ncbi:SDR family oxidoreductase [Amycolatopsis rhizosphaerae]|uniref:SDR family oxidoreductase n=1 Tax=Amycolatopsis rhizosphaerae TaxID=2053003 RepID=A0A558DJY0_9PSEU|nr:SDR family oxidoreductase [Amycolatopsis rhizosphaerae]TVT61318.1 SDR family oxidoreductase [Amycolatopsis rhizosphaerae]
MVTKHQPGPLLAGRTAVITGAAAGIGRGITEAFLAHGARVLAVDVDAAALAGLDKRAGDSPLATLRVDVTAPGAARRIADECEPDVVVHNVGHFLRPPTEFGSEAPAAWARSHDVNFGHVLTLTHALLPGMVSRGRGGSIITLTTVEAFRGIPGHVAYSAYKAAAGQFTRSLAVETGRHGVRVNAIAPDVVESRQLPYSDWVGETDRWRWATWAPLGRHGTADDVAGAALFLASDLSSFVTGTTVHVDGGTLAAGGWYPRHGGGWTNRPLDP